MAAGKRIFTDEYVGSLCRKYDRRPEYTRPGLYNLATGDAYAGERAWIEGCIADLASYEEAVRIGGLIARLRSADNHREASNELRAFAALRERGFKPRYELDFDGRTPDWYVEPSGNTSGFVVECITANVSDEMGKHAAKMTELFKRIVEKARHCGANDLGVFLHYREGACLDQPTCKRISQEFEKWWRTAPVLGSMREVEGILFEVVGGGAAMQYYQPWWNYDALRCSIKEKTDRYANACWPRKLPLVVAVVPGRGYWLTTWDFQVHQGFLEEAHVFPSATALVTDESGRWEMKLIHNPNALYPLPVGALAEDISP